MRTSYQPKDTLMWEASIGCIYFGLLLTLILFELNQRQSIQDQLEIRPQSPITLVFQFDREVLRLRQAINLALVSSQPIDREDILLRLDIAHSRMDLLTNSPSAAEITSSNKVRSVLERFSTIEVQIGQIVNAPEINTDALGKALLQLDELQQPIQALSFETSNRIYIALENQFQATLKQINLIISLLIAQMLVLLLGFAILKRRQIELGELNNTLQLRVAERTEAKAEAESANHSKSRFLAAASHDLRQPLAALALYTGMLGTVVKEGNGRLVSNIQNCVASLSELLNDLLDMSKLESGIAATNISIFSIDELCTSMLANYGATATKKGLRLRCRHAPGIVLRTDQQLFKRLLGNLIDNSLKFTIQGGVLIATRHRQGRMWVEVWDTGIGIPQSDIVHIFEEFRQLGDAGRYRGSGLGLTIAARITSVLGLKMRVDSCPGRGSVFAIELPVSDELPPTPLPVLPGHSVFTIGLVEDNRAILAALEVSLNSLGHTVFSGATGAELIENLGETTPDIVISDFQLESEHSGLDVIESLRNQYGQDIAAIVLTGVTDPNLTKNLVDHGIAVYTKPICLQDLQAFIGKALQKGH
ncbi:hypothetical protein DIC66_21635 [Rhodoferax lacus]|uniref:histidine kinase n=1 Tax=Rhodoferax lacus TaxID=2184758 RepID=A0A3E1R693_9BURK|nr:hybrid sensor histidine kinase/response regulator [Rhodoferax lacus]RFO94817.1 hypothetical protein DIC66_21635 [Rhodoferax lacus]